MALPIVWDFITEGEYWDYTTTLLPESPKIKKEKTKIKANIFTKIKWFVLVLVWKFNNRKWNKCRQKTKALNNYKLKIMKGHKE